MGFKFPAQLAAIFAFSFLSPCLCLAAAIPAGFPVQPLWLSENNVTAGDSVGIFTVLYNESTVGVKGSVAFSVDGAQVGTADFSLDPGKNEVLDTTWNATAGEHRIAAAIVQATDANTANVSLAGTEAAAISVDVASPPAPSQAEQNVAAVSNVVSTLVASSSPEISSAAQNTFALTEQVRQGAIRYLENQLGTTTGAQSEILGASTYRAPDSAASPATSSWWTAFVRGLEEAALVVARSVAFFYPVVAFIILGGLYLLMRTVRRPHSRY